MDVGSKLTELYGELDREIAAASPVCQASGRCCRFREYGHVLFLSRLEADRLLEVAPPAGVAISADGCPYQIGGLCSARERRPLGCRVYFCDPSFQGQISDLSERYIGALKALHDAAGMGWEYRPLHAFLGESRGAVESPGGGGLLPVLGELP